MKSSLGAETLGFMMNMFTSAKFQPNATAKVFSFSAESKLFMMNTFSSAKSRPKDPSLTGESPTEGLLARRQVPAGGLLARRRVPALHKDHRSYEHGLSTQAVVAPALPSADKETTRVQTANIESGESQSQRQHAFTARSK